MFFPLSTWCVNSEVLRAIRFTNTFYILHFPKHYVSLDRESIPRPLAYGNTASNKGTTLLTTKPNPLLQNRRFNDQGST
jgi:hypothetical protein